MELAPFVILVYTLFLLGWECNEIKHHNNNKNRLPDFLIALVACAGFVEIVGVVRGTVDNFFIFRLFKSILFFVN